MEQRFNDKRMWVWIVNFLVYVGVIAVFFTISGHEIIFCMYLPLDLLMNVSKAGYYFMHYFKDKREKERDEQLKEILKNELEKKVKAKIAGMFGA